MSDQDHLALLRGFLANAAARHFPTSLVSPESPTVDYIAGFADGWEAGHVAALALAIATLTGESITTLIEEATARAQVEMTFPFDLFLDLTSQEGRQQ